MANGVLYEQTGNIGQLRLHVALLYTLLDCFLEALQIVNSRRRNAYEKLDHVEFALGCLVGLFFYYVFAGVNVVGKLVEYVQDTANKFLLLLLCHCLPDLVIVLDKHLLAHGEGFLGLEFLVMVLNVDFEVSGNPLHEIEELVSLEPTRNVLEVVLFEFLCHFERKELSFGHVPNALYEILYVVKRVVAESYSVHRRKPVSYSELFLENFITLFLIQAVFKVVVKCIKISLG